jgi:IrrE N-terminal-like domain
MKNLIIGCTLKWMHLFTFLVLNSIWALGQSSVSQQQAMTIISNRQKLFNKQKNPKISCNEMKNIFIKNIDDTRKSIKDLDPLEDAQLRKYLKCPQTEWESMVERSAVDLYREQILNGLKRLGIIMPNKVIWASTRCPCYNATANYLGSSDLSSLKDYWFIEINSSLDINTGEYAKVAALATPITLENNSVGVATDLNSYIGRLNSDPYIFRSFMMRLLAHLVNDPAIDDESIKIGYPHLQIYASYSQYAQIFALSHELSHVLLNHKGTQQGLSVSNYEDESEIKLTYTSFAEGNPKLLAYKQEYEADSLGLEIMLSVMEFNYSSPSEGSKPDDKIKLFGIFGAEMLLTWMEIFQKAEIVTYGKYQGAKSHPPAAERRNRIRRILKRKSLIKADADFGLATYNAMNLMWNNFNPQLSGPMAQKIKDVKKPFRCRTND